ncbi:hypothetical protein GOP47_0021744 [Adiantum capillus-veneris]|uniref:RWP-RK domain-containing protein n=1 Tax=Adiantum capillus-veneris TaxID=13818 RepID=A0A9D4U8D8_ADICA|nr:hypothetical protein GOP47_0021744 [Adiantum capillus-veneris]
MEEPLLMSSHEPSNHLAALVVFMNSTKEEHIKSTHFYNRDGGALFSIEQEFLLTPGNYTCLSDSNNGTGVAHGDTSCFDNTLTALPLKQLMASLKKLQEIEGWKCVVEFASDCPHETTMVELLTPSRNADLKSLPSLAHDLAMAEAALIQSSCMKFQGLPDDQSYVGGRVACIDTEQARLDSISKMSTDWIVANPLIPAAPQLASPSIDAQTFGDIPGLETPDRIPINPNGIITSQGLQCSLWQTWGSDLELASPRLCKSTSDLNSWLRCDFSSGGAASQGILSVSSPASPKAEDLSLWTPALLDLSLNLPDITLDQQSEALLQLQGPPDDAGQLNIDVTATTFNLQDPTLTGSNDGAHVDATGIDCFSLECFGLDSSTCCNFYPEYTALESQEQLSSDSLYCMHPVDTNVPQTDVSTVSRQPFHGFSPLDAFLAHADNNSMALSSDSNISNGLQGMPSFSSSSIVDNAYSSTTTTGGTVGGTATSAMYWDGRGNMQLAREGRVTRRSAQAQGSTATSGSTITSQRQSQVQRGSSERVTEITIQELSQYFNMPITQASKELKVGLTVLKKKCREFGIPRWPHRKMKSLDSLINNIQASRFKKSTFLSFNLHQLLGHHPLQFRRRTELPLIHSRHHEPQLVSRHQPNSLPYIEDASMRPEFPSQPAVTDQMFSMPFAQDLAGENGGKGSTRVLNAVKELEEQKRLMEEMPGIELAERTKRLRQACFKASYKKRRLLSNTPTHEHHMSHHH